MMEAVALAVFERHTRAVELDRAACGAEWWAQVRPPGGARRCGKGRRLVPSSPCQPSNAHAPGTREGKPLGWVGARSGGLARCGGFASGVWCRACASSWVRRRGIEILPPCHVTLFWPLRPVPFNLLLPLSPGSLPGRQRADPLPLGRGRVQPGRFRGFHLPRALHGHVPLPHGRTHACVGRPHPKGIQGAEGVRARDLGHALLPEGGQASRL
jgi:hypothetical protein